MTSIAGRDQRRWSAIAIRLVVVTMAYNAVEALVALWSGFAAGSIALVGFGFDSVIELAAASAILWRLRVEARGASHAEVEASERRVLRFIGATFLALAAYVTVEASLTLWRQERPDASAVGIALAVASLIVMPLVSWGKLRAARALGSESLRAEAKETLACTYLSLTLLVGLAANAVAGWWWADAAAALLMVPWLVVEGLEGCGKGTTTRSQVDRCKMIGGMRTTLDIDEDILQAAKEIAAQNRTTAGKVLSNLARRALAPATESPVRHGVPLLPPRSGEGVVTMEEVNRLRDQD